MDWSRIKTTRIYGQLTYKMSKTYPTYLRYGNLKKNQWWKTHGSNAGRLQVAYTF